MNGLALCAGIGGIELGLQSAVLGYRTVCYVEREAFCASLLAARMADGWLHDAPIWDDVATFDGKPWRGVVDIVSAGYPCQPFSCAGKRHGAADPRHLWPHIARIIRECRPAYAFLENVPGHMSLGLRDVCADLRGLGYVVSAGVFSAAQCGALHMRKRLFALAHADNVRCGEWRSRPEIYVGGNGIDGSGIATLGNTNHAGLSKRQGWPTTYKRTAVVGASWWATEPDVGRVANGVPYRVDQLRALGNAVVPHAAALAWSTLSLHAHNLNV